MKRDYITKAIDSLVGDKKLSEAIVDKLVEEDLISLSFGNKEVDEIVTAFKTTFGTTRASKYDRFAAKRLSDKNGVKTVVQMIQILGTRMDLPYAPTIGSVSQLEEKWVSVVKFLRKTRHEGGAEL